VSSEFSSLVYGSLLQFVLSAGVLTIGGTGGTEECYRLFSKDCAIGELDSEGCGEDESDAFSTEEGTLSEDHIGLSFRPETMSLGRIVPSMGILPRAFAHAQGREGTCRSPEVGGGEDRISTT
jgi:hypothetical protein